MIPRHPGPKGYDDDLTIPQLSVNAIVFNEITVRACLCYMAVLQNQNLVTVADGSETMGDENACAVLFFENAVDVLQKGLFGVSVEGGCLLLVRTSSKKRVRVK